MSLTHFLNFVSKSLPVDPNFDSSPCYRNGAEAIGLCGFGIGGKACIQVHHLRLR